MVKVISIPVIAVVALIALLLLTASKPIDCVISDSNPYDSMPMVCKYVLKTP